MRLLNLDNRIVTFTQLVGLVLVVQSAAAAAVLSVAANGQGQEEPVGAISNGQLLERHARSFPYSSVYNLRMLKLRRPMSPIRLRPPFSMFQAYNTVGTSPNDPLATGGPPPPVFSFIEDNNNNANKNGENAAKRSALPLFNNENDNVGEDADGDEDKDEEPEHFIQVQVQPHPQHQQRQFYVRGARAPNFGGYGGRRERRDYPMERLPPLKRYACRFKFCRIFDT